MDRGTRIVFLLLVFFITGCNNMDKKRMEAWQLACKSSTKQSYQYFLDQYPDSKYAGRAKALIDSLTVFEFLDSGKLEQYFKQFPDKKQRVEILGEMTTMEMSVSSTNTPDMKMTPIMPIETKWGSFIIMATGKPTYVDEKLNEENRKAGLMRGFKKYKLRGYFASGQGKRNIFAVDYIEVLPDSTKIELKKP